MTHRGLYDIYLYSNKEYSQAFINRYGEFLTKSAEIIFGIKKSDLFSNRRWAEFVIVRKVLCNILTHYYNLHPTIIAEYISKDRSTVIYNGKQHKDWVKYDKNYSEAFTSFTEFVADSIDSEDLKKNMSLHMNQTKDDMIKHLQKEVQLLKQKFYDNKIVN